MPLGGPQESHPGAIPGAVVLEGDLVEPGQGVADVRRVVDRQATLAVGIDVGERAVRKRRALPCRERGHGTL